MSDELSTVWAVLFRAMIYLACLTVEADRDYDRDYDPNATDNNCAELKCLNGGRCYPEWPNSFACDCDMTSFDGPNCNQDGVGYAFGAMGGIVSFTFNENERVDSVQDSVAFGLITSQLDATLLHVTSATSKDYLDIELVDGNVFAVYNLGTVDHPIGEVFTKVNDGAYHVVRFMRQGPNSTIQIDDLAIQAKHPTGRQLVSFNSQSQIFIGGKRTSMGKNTQLFHGVIAGLVWNSHRLLQLASEEDSRTEIDGDVKLNRKPLTRSYIRRQLQPSKFPSPTNKTPSKNGKQMATASCKPELGLNCVPNKANSALMSPKSISPSSSPLSTSSLLQQQEARRADDRSTHLDQQQHHSQSIDVLPCPPDEKNCTSWKRRATSASSPDGANENVQIGGPVDALSYAIRHEGGSDGGANDNSLVVPISPSLPPSNIDADSLELPVAASVGSAGSLATRQSSDRNRIEKQTAPPPKGVKTNSERGSSVEATSSGGQHSSTRLIVGVTAAGSVLLALLTVGVCVVCRCRKRDEGSYKIDELTNSDGYEIVCRRKPLIRLNKNSRNKFHRQKRKDKEWYV